MPASRWHVAGVFSLYRTFLRTLRSIPDEYARSFCKFKVSDNIRDLLKAEPSDRLSRQRLKNITRLSRRLHAAGRGDYRAFEHVLALAYGRKGKLRRELFEFLLSSDPVPCLIPGVQRSRPPVYSAPLAALASSPISRPTNPLSRRHLDSPPNLSPRANPESDEAHLLGRLSKRLELNIRRRHFRQVTKLILPPLQMYPYAELSLEENHRIRDGELNKTYGPITLDHITSIIGSRYAPPPVTRRECAATSFRSPVNCRHPSRWVRRRYQSLLGEMPLLGHNKKTGNYTVYRSPLAIHHNLKDTENHLTEIDDPNLEWLKLAESIEQSSKNNN